jgi:cystathionine beta-synthase
MVRLNSIPDLNGPTILGKIEYLNPGGSSKDRIAVTLVEDAERSGLLRPGGTIVEPTSGNTGVGLALVANQRGYRAIFVVPDKVAADKIAVLKAYGAQVVVTPTGVPPEHPDSYYSVADRLVAQIPGAFKPNQFSNPAGPDAHYATTGPEIWRDTEGAVTHFIAPVGTGGTISGTGRYLKEVSSGRVQVIGADPVGSIYSDPDNIHGYLVEGAGEDFYPEAYDPSVVDRVIGVQDADSFAMTRRLAREESLLVGGTSGMAVQVALRVACTARPTDLIVALLPDSGRGYLGKLFDDLWLASHGLDVAAPPVPPIEVLAAQAFLAEPKEATV